LARLDGRLGDGRLGDGRLSDGRLSDGRLSDGSLSDGSLSDGSLSDGSLSDGSLSDELLARRHLLVVALGHGRRIRRGAVRRRGPFEVRRRRLLLARSDAV